jgi:hypothetical protein
MRRKTETRGKSPMNKKAKTTIDFSDLLIENRLLGSYPPSMSDLAIYHSLRFAARIISE